MKRKTLILCSWIFIMITIIMGNNNFSYGKATTNDPTVESGGNNDKYFNSSFMF